jgi:hypothetical protein
MKTVLRKGVVERLKSKHPEVYTTISNGATHIDDGGLIIARENMALVRATIHGGSRGLGDIVEVVAKPIARVLGMKCMDENGQLKPESKCAQRRNALNRIFPGG